VWNYLIFECTVSSWMVQWGFLMYYLYSRGFLRKDTARKCIFFVHFPLFVIFKLNYLRLQWWSTLPYIFWVVPIEAVRRYGMFAKKIKSMLKM
jgi:hypothetical protein